MALAQPDLVKQIEDALRSRTGEAVYDFGKLLKPQGITELQQLARQFQTDGLNVYFVTITPDGLNPDALTESVYRDAGLTVDDILIVFNGKRVYGKTAALQGDPQAFQEAFRISRPSFNLYYAKGLADFARVLRDRIVQRRAAESAEQRAAEQRGTWLWSGLLAFIVALVGAVIYRRMKIRQEARKAYDERLQQAELVFQQVEAQMPSGLPLFERVSLDAPDDMPDDVASEFLRLSADLRRCRERVGTTTADVDRLITRLELLNHQLAKPLDGESFRSTTGAITDSL
jgi:DNA primase